LNRVRADVPLHTEYHWLPFSDCRISGSRLRSAFFAAKIAFVSS
jgi:hypothetical protein